VVWEEFPPVILLCAISFLLNHDDMILTCAFFPEIAGGLFHFKKDHAQYNLKPEDYANKPLFLASKEKRFLNEFFLYTLEDLHTCRAAPMQSDDEDAAELITRDDRRTLPSSTTRCRQRARRRAHTSAATVQQGSHPPLSPPPPPPALARAPACARARLPPPARACARES
jgi:hypothetical protein